MKGKMSRLTKAKKLIGCVLLAATCPASLVAEDVVLTIRLINGKNGKPITDENLNVFRNGSRFAENFRADHNGVIRLTIDRDAVVDFASNIQVTCHPYSANDGSEHLPRLYRVREILETGISDKNMCSKKISVEAKPGEFVYYERPRTFWEWMSL
jgi:hypothetical protein